MAYDRKVLHLQAPIKIRLHDVVPPAELGEGWPRVAGRGEPWLAETTLGRVLFNELLPSDYPYVNEPLLKKRQAAIINDLAERYSMTEVAQVLDRLKDAGFYWATRSGVTLAISDVVVPPNKQEILDGYEVKADQVNKRYQRGALSHQERNDEMVKIWSQASEEVARAMEENFPRTTRSRRS